MIGSLPPNMPSRTKRPSRRHVTPKRYPTDLTDVEWERISPLLPRAPIQDGKPTVDLREIVNALRFKVRITGGWSMLPTDFGSREVVHWWFRRFLRRLLLRMVCDVGAMIRVGHTNGAPAPPAGSQVVPRHRRSILVRPGNLHRVDRAVTEIAGRTGSQAILDAVVKRWPWVKHLLGDGPYDRGALVSKPVLLEFLSEVVRRMTVEPSLRDPTQEIATAHDAVWLMKWRPVVRQYEDSLDISDTPAWPWETC
jgi:putative transposase